MEDQRYLRQSSEGFERRLLPAWYDLVERLLHIPALAKEVWTDTMDPREMASRLADRMTMLLDEDPTSLDKACQAAGLAILGDPSPYAMLEYELTPSMGTLDGLPLHTIQVHQDLALLELVTSWQTYVTELPYVTRRVTIEPTPSPGTLSESFAHSHPDAKWAIENRRHEGVVWQGDSLYALEDFWATRTIRLRGGYLAVLGLALAYNYDAMVARLTGEPGWMPADREHLLGYFCNHESGLIEESKSYANAWEWESAAAPSERPDLIESISPTRPQL